MQTQFEAFDAEGVFDQPIKPLRIRKHKQRRKKNQQRVRPRRPKLPTAPLWRSLAQRGLYVLQGLIEKPLPRAVAKQPTERSGKVKYFEPYEAKTYDDIDSLMDLLSPGLAGSEELPTLDIRPTAKGIDAAFGRKRSEELYAREQQGSLPGQSLLHEAWKRQHDAGLTSLPPEKRPPINYGVVAPDAPFDPGLLRLPDGKVLDLKTGERRAAKPEDLIIDLPPAEVVRIMDEIIALCHEKILTLKKEQV